jgi:hypothetical protein
MWLTILSLFLNGLFLLAIILFITKPEIFNSTIDNQFKARYNALQKYYQDEENKLQRQLATQTREVTDEIFALRRKLESDINNEVEESRRQRHLEVNRTLEERIAALRDRELRAEEELMRRFEQFKLFYDVQKEEIEQKLESLKSAESAAVAARIRMYEEANKEKFYMIQIEESDSEEIDELLDILPKLRNPVPLRKALFDIYYRQPVKDMIYRVVGPDERPSGVYKITFIETGECYVGQSVDIGSRFMQHIRRGFGIDDISSSKLYTAMLKYGLHKFKFEVVERCDEELLNEKEKYWADYFKSREFGFSIKN